MAGLLDFFNTEDGRIALGLLAAGAPRAGGRQSIGGGLLESLNGVDAWKQQKAAQEGAAQDRALKQQMLQAQIQEHQSAAQMQAAKIAEAQRSAARQAKFQADLSGAGSVGPSEALAGGGGPTNANAGKLGAAKPVNWNALAMQYPDQIEMIKKLAEANNFGRNKVARVEETMVDGRPVKQQFDDYGGVVGSALPQWKAPKEIDTGGQIGMLDPVTMKILTQFKKTQTPGEVASTGLGYARLAHDKQQAANSAAAGQLIETPEGYVRVSKDNRATAIMAPTGVQPLMGNGSKLPEAAQKQVLGARNVQQAVSDYQAKLATWSNSKMLSPDARAEMGNAYNNMMLQAKEAYNLGVLNGPDYAILQSVVKDPTKLTSIATSNEALSGQAGELSRIASNIEKNALNAHGKKYTPFAPNKPALTSGGVKFLGFE